jgi:hypothetical protein
MSIKTWLLLLFVPVAAGIMLLVLPHPRVSELFHKHISDRPKRRLFLAAIGFFVTFAVARTLAYVNFHNIGPFHDIYIGGRHIHHLVWGILILLVVGFAWLQDVGVGGEKIFSGSKPLDVLSLRRGRGPHPRRVRVVVEP